MIVRMISIKSQTCRFSPKLPVASLTEKQLNKSLIFSTSFHRLEGSILFTEPKFQFYALQNRSVYGFNFDVN